MEAMIQFLAEDGVTTATIIVLLAMFKEIRDIGKEVKGFYEKMFFVDGSPRYRRIVDCDSQMNSCRGNMENLRIESIQHTSLISKLQFQIESLMAKTSSSNKDKLDE